MRRRLTITFTLLFLASPASAALLDFDLTWQTRGVFDGGFDNGIPIPPQLTATGTIRVNDAIFPNPQSPPIFDTAANLGIVDFSILVEGATFGLSDFAQFVWGAGSIGLDLTQELVGQSTGMGTWGVDAGDFNFFAGGLTTLLPPPVLPPTGAGEFTFVSNGWNLYHLTSFRPAPQTNPIPEPSAALLYVGGLLVVATRARRTRQAA